MSWSKTNSNEVHSKSDYIEKQPLKLSKHQEKALSRIEYWLPKITFELHSRILQDSASHHHLLAIGRILTQTSQCEEGWVLASIPNMSDKIILMVTRENPLPFIDFMTTLDMLSETADHLQHGFSASINHTILNNRGQNSYILAEFNELWPRLHIKKNRPRQTSRQYMNRNESNFDGLLVLLSSSPHTKQHYKTESQHYNVQAIARSKSQLLQIALPPRSYPLEGNTTFEESFETNEPSTPIDTHTEVFTLSSDTIDKYEHNTTQTSIEANEEISAADLKLFKRYVRYTSKRTYLLFGLFLITSLTIFLALH